MATLPIGHRIRARRKERGLTQTALAKSLGISVSYVNLIEHDKRSIGGTLLNRLAEALELEPGALSGTLERRMLQELEQLRAEPVLAEIAIDLADARTLIARHEHWARALIALRRAHQSDQRLIAALSNRLNHDPALNSAVHEMLSAAAAIRSVADIFEETDDLESDQRKRFDAILSEEARRLSGVAHALASALEQSEATISGSNAAEEVDDFLYANGNHFPMLEEAAERAGFPAPPDLAVLAERLARHGIATRSVDLGDLAAQARNGCVLDPQSREMRVALGTQTTSKRFELARELARIEARDEIAALVAAAPELTSDAARARAETALAAYVAAALLMPYAPFHASVEGLRYDIDALAHLHGASPEQLCHRFTTLRRPGAEGVPFGMLRANAAGYLTKRFPLPRFPIPRYGGACPLWAVYAAMQTPDMRVRQIAEFPNGDRFFCIARASRPPPMAHGRSRPSFTLMLVCDILQADRLVYADGLDLTASAIAEPVGSACVLCPRDTCAHRQERPVRLGSGEA